MTPIHATARQTTEGESAATNDVENRYVRASHATFDLVEHDLAMRCAWLGERPRQWP